MMIRRSTLGIVLSLALAACAGSPDPPVITAGSAPLAAHAGDALKLRVDNLQDGATVNWSGAPVVRALPEGSEPTESILPQSGDGPTSYWLENPDHYGANELSGVLFVLDPGTQPNPVIEVRAAILDDGAATEATAQIPVTPMLVGEVARGATIYAANCARCHGASGEGKTDYPALNNNPGLPAAEWSAPLFADVTRGDLDDMGVSLRLDMPKWLVQPDAAGALLEGQDFADIFAWLKTQTTAPVGP